MADAAAKSVNGMVRSAAPAAAGLGIGAAIMALLQGSPQVVTEIVRWGPALLVIALGAILLDRHAGPAIGAIRDVAGSQGRLAAVIEDRFRAEDDVRAACRALSGQVERLGEHIVEIRAHVCGAPRSAPGETK
jgi:hypothetical protein